MFSLGDILVAITLEKIQSYPLSKKNIISKTPAVIRLFVNTWFSVSGMIQVNSRPFPESLKKRCFPAFSVKTLRYFFTLLFVGCFLSLAVGQSVAEALDKDAVNYKSAKGKVRHVTLQLPWLNQFQFAGYYAAVEKGFYREAGFKVTVLEGSPDRGAVEEVVSGRANYGVARSELLLHRLHGKPVVVLAAVFQHSAIILLAKKESGIDNPQSMIGKRVMLLKGDNAAEYVAMFHKEGVSLDRLKVIPSSYNIDDLIDDKTDVFNAYSTNEPYYLESRNIPAMIISPRAYGIDFYGDCLFTSEQELEEHPVRVKAFHEASLRGWNYALAHPEEIIDLILTKYSDEKTRDHLRFEAKAIRKLMLPDLVEIGHMNPGRWRHIADTYVDLGMAEPDYSLEGFIYDPNPKPDYTWLWWIAGVTITISLMAGLVSVFLLFFNRRLQTEIDERTKTEEALKESEERLKSFYNAAFEGIVISEEGRIIDANNRFADILGYKRDELIGKEVVSLTADEDKELVLRNIRSDFDKPYESKALHKAGSIVFVEVHGQKIKYNGRPARVTAIHNITDRKRAEEAREQLISELKTALVEVKTLRGIVPICSNCKSIRDDAGYWQQVEEYLQDHSEALFSHGICPECAKKLYPEFYDEQ